MMKKRAQAAMEFLMTYGWAILVVLLAIGALAYFGVLDPSRLLPESTTFPAPLANVDTALIDSADNTIEIAFVNNKGFAITLPLTGTVSPDAATTCVLEVANPISGTYDGAAITAGTVIPNGATFLVEWDCQGTGTIGDKFKADLTFNYNNTQTSQVRSHAGAVQGRYE